MDATARREAQSPVPVAGETSPPAAEAAGEKVFVALPAEHKAGRAVLAWALGHDPGDATLVLCHVHVPPQMIPLMGTKFHASKLRPEQVNAYRQSEMEKVHKQLDEYIYQCSKSKFKAEKLVFEKDDIVEGLIELIALHGITKLVMGAAADRHYSKKMTSPASKTAIAVMEKADPSCKIFFVCKEQLICTREAGTGTSWGAQSPFSSSSSISDISEQLRSQSLPPGTGSPNFHPSVREELFMQRSGSDNTGTRSGRIALGLPHQTNEVLRNSGFSSLPRYNDYEVGSEVLPSIDESGDNGRHVSPCHEQEEMGLDVDLFENLQEAFVEVENLRKKAFDEAGRRQKAEQEFITYRQKARKSEDLLLKEVHRRKAVEETFARVDREMERLKEEMELVKQQRDHTLHRLQETNKQKLVLEQRVTESDRTAKDLEGKLAAARYQLDAKQIEFNKLQFERDAAVRKVEDLCSQGGDTIIGVHGALLSEFTSLELQQATENFSDSQKIGEGGFGCVYKGLLRNTTVAIKKLHSESLQGQSQFQQEVVVLSRVRHPNLVTLIGACQEASALVYEFCPNGSLEERLVCRQNTPPLSWQVRTRIIREICSALIFLHSAKPHPVAHGDLKPANILLDANMVSKLSDFGISRLLSSDTNATTLYYTTNPRGTFAYMDPEFLTTGELTPRSDIYSFGIIVLRLLTGKPPLAIAREVEDALENNDLESVLDKSAGEWPFFQAQQLIVLGLRCAELSRRNRPNLVNDVWKVVSLDEG